MSKDDDEFLRACSRALWPSRRSFHAPVTEAQPLHPVTLDAASSDDHITAVALSFARNPSEKAN